VGLALVTRIPNLMEAHIAVGALRSAGIAAEVFDGNFGAIEAPVIEGLGGYRVMAPAEEVAEARATLKALRATPGLSTGEAESPWDSPASTTGQSVRRAGMRWIALLYLGAPLIIWLLFQATLSPGR
jgi:Putative prokaryotic signal transducing protein